MLIFSTAGMGKSYHREKSYPGLRLVEGESLFTSGVYTATACDAAFSQEKPHIAQPKDTKSK
jgi:hypothetical protein